MKEREELELILELIGKYNLPLSPILEYAVKEKMEEYPKEEATDFVNDERTEDGDIPDDDYNNSFLPKSNDIKWFCLSVLTCLEGLMDNRTYQILNDTLKGESRSTIALKHRLTQERIRQIVVKATKQAKELLIEQHNNLEKEKENNARLNVQLNLMRENVVRLKALLPKELLSRQTDSDENLDAELVELLETHIEDINLPVRASNILLFMGIKKFADIPMIESEDKVLGRRNSGRKTVRVISMMLKDFQLSFGMSLNDVYDVLKSYDWNAAKRKWIRGSERNEEIIEPIVETKDKEPSVSDIEKTFLGDEEAPSSQDYVIDNKQNRCYIVDARGERVFSSDGQVILLNKIYYKVSYTDSIVSMVIIKEKSKGIFSYGRRILSAHSHSPLYTILDKQYYLTQFKAVKYDDDCNEYYIKVGDRWYGSSGYYADLNWDKKNRYSSVDSVSDSTTTYIDDEEASLIMEPTSNVMEVEHVFLDSHNNIIEKIYSSCDVLDIGSKKENRKGKPWTEDEEELIKGYFEQGKETSEMATIIGRTEVAVKVRLAKLGLIDYVYGQEDEYLSKTYKPVQKQENGAHQSTMEQVDNVGGGDDDEPDEIVEVGYVLELFPSHRIGEIIDIKKLKNGLRKLVVRFGDGSIREEYDNNNLYSIIGRNSINKKEVESGEYEEDDIEPSLPVEALPAKKEAFIGDDILYDGKRCKVIDKKTICSSMRLIVQYEDGTLDNVPNDWNRYSLMVL